MTPDDILAQLPNGMHDASISAMHVEFGARRVTLDLEFWVGDLDSEDEQAREAHRFGRLVLDGVEAMVVDPPDPADKGSRFSPEEGIDVHGEFGTCPGDPPVPDDGKARLWFFVENWNRWMRFTARECALVWA
jgi:hypothetical protein